MFSAVEALVKIQKGPLKGKKDWEKLGLILGKPLKEELWGEQGKSSAALRHRLVHGEYFNGSNSGKDYLDLLHKKIIGYFNDCIFKEKLIREKVVNPQRHFFGNYEQWRGFIRAKEKQELSLDAILSDLEKMV